MQTAFRPVLNLFHKDTWLPASIVTLVIILVEGGLLRWRIKQITFGGALWRSAVINIASSAIGSILLLAFGRDSYFMWDTMGLVFPLFMITLATEIPLLHFLFKQLPMTWGRACNLGIGINLASYAVVFVMEIGFLAGFISYAGHLDRKELAEWQNPTLLKQVTGTIYATTGDKGTHVGLRVFDPQAQTWILLTNCPSVDAYQWDVKGQVCAFVRQNTGDVKATPLVISRLPDFSVLHEIGFDQFMDHKFDNPDNWQGITDLALSPNAKYLAILFAYTDAVAFKDDASYYNLGRKCRLIVIDVDSGKEITRAPRWASDSGLCWLPESRMVLFPSFDDEKLYEATKSEVRGSTSYGVGYAKGGQFARSIFAFNLDTGGVARFSDGCNPSLAARKRQILVCDNSTLRLLDLLGQEKMRIEVPHLGYRGAVVSPDGTLILAEIRRHFPFNPRGNLTLVALTSPSTRHILSGDLSYKYEWIEVRSNQASDAMRP